MGKGMITTPLFGDGVRILFSVGLTSAQRLCYLCGLMRFRLFGLLVLGLLLGTFSVKAQGRKVIGRVVTSAGKQGIPFATLMVYNEKDSLLGGALCNEKGEFETLLKASGKLRAKASSIDFEPAVVSISIPPMPGTSDIGDIALKAKNQLLNEVEISAEREALSLSIDRRSYIVDKDLAARGGNAIDALKNIPGVIVGTNNTVELRNQSPSIFVDGRPSLMTLDMIPADEIERIEVITNPSARYTADARGGIINVVMKKNLKPGYSGRVNAGVGTLQRRSLQGNIQVREGKANYRLSAGINQSFNPNNGSSNREYGAPDSVYLRLLLDNNNRSFRDGYNVNAGFDYQTGLRSMLSSNYSYSTNTMRNTELQEFGLYAAQQEPFFSGVRSNLQINNWEVHSGSVLWKKSYAEAERELTLDANVTHSNNINNLDANTAEGINTYNYSGNRNRGKRQATLYSLQGDYVKPGSNEGRWETGFRLSYKYSVSEFESAGYSDSSGVSVNDPTLSNRIAIDDFIGAAYVIRQMKLGKWSLNAGLRYEHTWFVAQTAQSAEDFAFIYPRSLSDIDKVLFPSVYLSRKGAKGREFQVNMSRKIGRPGWMQLIPFVTYADRQSVQIGNPVLAPEFILLGEMNYSLSGDGWSGLMSVYARNTEGAITTVVFPLPNNPEVLVNTYANGRQRQDAGSELTLKRKLGSKVDLSAYGHAFYSRVNVVGDTVSASNAGWSWNTRLQVNYRPNTKLSLQLSGSYEAPRIIPQGTLLSVYFADFSVNYRFNKHWQISATLSDVANTKRFGTRINNDLFTQELVRRWEVRYLRFNVTWNFGEQDVSVFRRRSQWRREPGGGGTEMPEL